MSLLRSSYIVLPLAASFSTACLLPLSSRKPGQSRRRIHRLSCKCMATAGDEDATHLVDRRDVLLGLTGLASSSSLGGLALAADAGCAQDVTDKVLQCTPQPGDPFYCPSAYDPTKVNLVHFNKLPKPTGTKRVRRPAHLLDAADVARFEEGIRRMKALPDSDPRSFENQRSIHAAYCDNHYKVVAADGSSTMLDVHFSSIFAPWHRMYIYFFERILGDLVSDYVNPETKEPYETPFALPYWNWDAPDGMGMPAMFMKAGSPLHHSPRNSEEKLRAFMDLNIGPANQTDLLKKGCTDEEEAFYKAFNKQSPNPSSSLKEDARDRLAKQKQILESNKAICLTQQTKNNNLYSMYRQMTVDSATCFHGSGFCKGGSKASGTLENGGHTAAHIWVGGDMGVLRTAAQDPIFYTNHSNVDRLWHIWRTVHGGNDPTDANWLHTSFVFYDEQQRPVSIRIKDVVDLNNLGYTYEKKDRLEWLDKTPKAATRIPGSAALVPLVPRLPPAGFPMNLEEGKTVRVTLERPANKTLKSDEEVLVVDMKVDPCDNAYFDVLVNVAEGEEGNVDLSDSRYLDNFAQVPHGCNAGSMKPMGVSHRFTLKNFIRDYIKSTSGDTSYITVTLRRPAKLADDGSKLEPIVIQRMDIQSVC